MLVNEFLVERQGAEFRVGIAVISPSLQEL
jgi:hypothetical protein